MNDVFEESSEDRYNQLKKEEAQVNSGDPVKNRYQELKEEAKKEFLERQRRREQENEEEEEEQKFVTY